MLVDISDVLLGGARDRVRYAWSMLAEDMHEVADPSERAHYLRNRCASAARSLAEALELIRVYWTKVSA